MGKNCNFFIYFIIYLVKVSIKAIYFVNNCIYWVFKIIFFYILKLKFSFCVSINKSNVVRILNQKIVSSIYFCNINSYS